MRTVYPKSVETARQYYNSKDADEFYYRVWGGEDIHVGLYESDDEPIGAASRRTVEHLASKIGNLTTKHQIIDLGSGFGGAARYLAGTFGCRVTAVNLSETENQRHRDINAERGLDEPIEVLDANFEALPIPDARFDAAWSQDAILHSGDRGQVLREVSRVLKPGGVFVFTDPMQADQCPEGVLQPILDRIHLDSLASPAFYRETASDLGLEEVEFEDLTHQLVRHYGQVLAETQRNESELSQHISPDYLANMKRGLQYWVEGGNNGWLTWGVFVFRKPSV